MGAAAAIVLAHMGAVLRSVIGFPGGMQMLAGVHVVWIAIAALIIPKKGAATVTGILKGSVEFLAGSPHGLFVLLVAIAAGILIDIAIAITPRKWLSAGIIAGSAMAAASNIVLFQMFAQLPANRMVLTALIGFAAIAAISGATLAGVPSLILVWTLGREGLARNSKLVEQTKKPMRMLGVIIAAAVVIVLSALSVKPIIIAATTMATPRGQTEKDHCEATTATEEKFDIIQTEH